MTQDNPTHYEVLGVPMDAPYLEIRRAYRQRAKQYHPDRLQQPTSEDQARFARIAEAYRVLSDLKRRRDYDLSLRPQAGQATPPQGFYQPHYTGYPYFRGDIFTPYMHAFFMGSAYASPHPRETLQTILFNYKTLAIAILGALYFFRFFTAFEGTVVDKRIEERLFRNVSYVLTLQKADDKAKRRDKRVKFELYDQLKLQDHVEKNFFSMTYRINEREIPGPPLDRIALQVGLIYLVITATLYFLERSRRE